MLDQNLDLKEKLASVIDRATQDAIPLLLAQAEAAPAPAEPTLDWMTATQLARYWQLMNAHGEPTTAGILKWAKRSRMSIRYRTRTWATCCDSIETRLIYGHMKKLKDDECRTKNGV